MCKIESFQYINNNSNKTILYLHGWDSSYKTLLPLKQQTNDYNQLFIDLPGCGYNNKLTKPLKIKDYIAILTEFLKEETQKIQIIVGHSFGGKLAIKMQNIFVNLKGLFLISPAILKKKRTLIYYFKIYKYKLYKKLKFNTDKFGSDDYKNANKIEKQTLINVVNEDGKKEAKSTIIPTILLWGDKDLATPYYMAIKLNKIIKSSNLIKIKGDHFAFLDVKNNANKILESFIKGVDKNANY